MAELGKSIDPVASQQLADYSYVDDNLMGGSPEDVERMRGVRIDGEYTGTVPRILAKGAMKVKFMAVSGSSDEWEAEQLAGKTLGVLYRLQQDEIYFVLRPGYYADKQKKLGPGSRRRAAGARAGGRAQDGDSEADQTAGPIHGNGPV